MDNPQKETFGDTWKRWGVTKLLAGLAIGALVVPFTPLAMWEGEANNMARDTASAKVLAALTPICIARVSTNPAYGERIAELDAETQPYKRTQIVKKIITDFDSAQLPGMERADTKLEAACSQGLLDALDAPPA